MDSSLSIIQDGKIYNIELGSTFRKRKDIAFHTVRYDFKPASVDLTQQGQVMVGETNDVGENNVSISLPHQQGSKSSSIVYKGSKKPAQKECVLIYDKDTRSFTLERINSQIQVKKTRSSGNASLPLPNLPAPVPAKLGKKSAKKTSTNRPSKPTTILETRKNEEDKLEVEHPPATLSLIKTPEESDLSPPKRRNLSASSSSAGNSSSSDSSSSDNESSSNDESSTKSSPVPTPTSQLEKDLELSDLSEDSDSSEG